MSITVDSQVVALVMSITVDSQVMALLLSISVNSAMFLTVDFESHVASHLKNC